MDKEQQRHDELEAPLLPGDGGKAAAAAGSAYALVCSLVASAISVIYGYNRGVMSGAQKFVQDDLGISDAQIEVLIGATSIYSLVGSLAAGWACDCAGRRRTMALSAAMFFAGSAITSVAGGYAALMAGQLVAGVACGFGLVVAPVYIAEMAPAASRGFLSSIPEGVNPVSSANPMRTVKVLALSSSGDNLHAVLNILRWFPCLEKLYVIFDQPFKMDKENEPQHDPLHHIECLQTHLKKVVFKSFVGHKKQDFAKFFVLNAKVLNKMELEVYGDYKGEALAFQHRLLQVENRASREAQFEFTRDCLRTEYVINKCVHDLSVANPFRQVDA